MLLLIILAAYRDFEERIDIVGGRQNAVAIVRRAVSGRIGKFTKSELLELCPTISRTSVEGALRQLVKEGVIIRHGSGRATFYTRND